jgi:hypothetical protein
MKEIGGEGWDEEEGRGERLFGGVEGRRVVFVRILS